MFNVKFPSSFACSLANSGYKGMCSLADILEHSHPSSCIFAVRATFLGSRLALLSSQNLIFTTIFYSSSKTIQNLVPRLLVTGVYLFLILYTFQEREYLTLVTVTSIPPLTCYGSGLTVDASREEAANSALKALLQSGLDRSSAVKSLEENPGTLHPQRAHMVCKWTTSKLILFYL